MTAADQGHQQGQGRDQGCDWSMAAGVLAGMLEQYGYPPDGTREHAAALAAIEACEQVERLQAEAAALREALAVATVCDHGHGLDCPDCEPVPPIVRQALAGTAGRAVVAVLAATREVAELARFHADSHGPYPLPGLCAALADYDRAVRVMAAVTPPAETEGGEA